MQQSLTNAAFQESALEIKASTNLRLRQITILIAVLIMVYVSRHFVLDDGRIYGHYIQNALAGNGLVFNIGEPVNALTSPLYAYLLLLFSFILHGHISVAAILLFGTSFLGACLLAESLVPFAGLLMCTMNYFYYLLGMETTLLLLLILLALTLYKTERYTALPTVLILCFLTRAESAALIPVFAWLLYKKRALPRPWTLTPALTLLLAYFAVNHHLYGSFLSSSASAKFGQGRSGYWGRWPHAFLGGPFRALMKDLFRYNPYTLVFLVIAAPIGLFKTYSIPWVRAGLAFASILLVFYVGFNLPNYHWYYAPFITLTILLAAAALPHAKWATALIALIVVLQAASCTYAMHLPQDKLKNYDAVAGWIEGHSPRTASIEAAEIGELAFVSNRRVRDILGLTEPKNANHIAHKDLSSWLEEDHPDFIVVHKPAWLFEEVAVKNPDYNLEPFHSGDVYILKRIPGK